MSVKTFSISMGERAYRQARAEADRRTGHDWADWTEANAGDFPPSAGKGAA